MESTEKQPLKKVILEFLKSRIFLKNLIYAVSIGLGTLFITFLFLRIYTHHGEAIPVPDLTGMPLSEAAKILENNNLSYEIIDSIFTDVVPKGAVFEQNPPIGFNVKRKRKIFLTINAYNTEKVPMPDLVDASLIQAKSDLAMSGLNIGRIEYIEHYAQNFVLKQKFNGKDIEEGELIEKGSRILLVIGKGDETTEEIETHVPNLYGLTVNEAYNLVTDFYLNIGTVEYDATVKETAKNQAVIYKTEPNMKYRTKELGMNINIWLTTNKMKAKEEKVKAENAPPPEPEVDSTQVETEEEIF